MMDNPRFNAARLLEPSLKQSVCCAPFAASSVGLGWRPKPRAPPFPDPIPIFVTLATPADDLAPSGDGSVSY